MEMRRGKDEPFKEAENYNYKESLMSSSQVSTNEGLEVDEQVLQNLKLIPFRLTAYLMHSKAHELQNRNFSKREQTELMDRISYYQPSIVFPNPDLSPSCSQLTREMSSKQPDSQKNEQNLEFAPPVVKLLYQTGFQNEREQIEKKITQGKDLLMQKWLREFVSDQLRNEIMTMHCPHALQYWDWFFGYYPLKPELLSNGLASNHRLNKFGWYECIFFLEDRIFIQALHTWWEKKQEYRKHPLFRKADVHFIFYYHNPPSAGLGSEQSYINIPRLSNNITQHCCHPSSLQCFSSKALQKHYLPNDEFMLKRPKYPNLHFFISHYTDFFTPKIFMVERYTCFDSYIARPDYCIGNGFNIFKEPSQWRKKLTRCYQQNRNKYHITFTNRGRIPPKKRRSLTLPPQVPASITKLLTQKSLSQNREMALRLENYFRQSYGLRSRREGQGQVREILEFGADFEGEKLIRLKNFMEEKRGLFKRMAEQLKQGYASERGSLSKKKIKAIVEEVGEEVKQGIMNLFQRFNTGQRWKTLKIEQLLYRQEPQTQKRKRIT